MVLFSSEVIISSILVSYTLVLPAKEETCSYISQPVNTAVKQLENFDVQGIKIPEKSMEIVEEGYRFIRDDAVGDMLIKDLEKEAIKRTLKFFNNNRRKTAKSLGMSERTLYRKIEEFNIEPKIKSRVKHA